MSLRSISDLQFSPDGSRLAFVVSEPPKGERVHFHAIDLLRGLAAMAVMLFHYLNFFIPPGSEEAAPNFRSYIAEGSDHCIMPLSSFYTRQAGGVRFRDWVADMAGGKKVENVICAGCESPRSTVSQV